MSPLIRSEPYTKKYKRKQKENKKGLKLKNYQ